MSLGVEWNAQGEDLYLGDIVKFLFQGQVFICYNLSWESFHTMLTSEIKDFYGLAILVCPHLILCAGSKVYH
jgi:hypothetical protein